MPTQATVPHRPPKIPIAAKTIAMMPMTFGQLDSWTYVPYGMAKQPAGRPHTRAAAAVGAAVRDHGSCRSSLDLRKRLSTAADERPRPRF